MKAQFTEEQVVLKEPTMDAEAPRAQQGGKLFQPIGLRSKRSTLPKPGED